MNEPCEHKWVADNFRVCEKCGFVDASRHVCDLSRHPYEEGGPAVKLVIEEQSGELWVTNGEYATQVNFCPKCGYKARQQVKS